MNGIVYQIDTVLEVVAKDTGNFYGHIDSRSAQFAEGNDPEGTDLSVGQPNRLHAQHIH